jgi:hypothetical protein
VGVIRRQMGAPFPRLCLTAWMSLQVSYSEPRYVGGCYSVSFLIVLQQKPDWKSDLPCMLACIGICLLIPQLNYT